MLQQKQIPYLTCYKTYMNLHLQFCSFCYNTKLDKNTLKKYLLKIKAILTLNKCKQIWQTSLQKSVHCFKSKPQTTMAFYGLKLRGPFKLVPPTRTVRHFKTWLKDHNLKVRSTIALIKCRQLFEIIPSLVRHSQKCHLLFFF